MNADSEQFMQPAIANHSFDNTSFSTNYPCEYYEPTTPNTENENLELLQNGGFHEVNTVNEANGGDQYYRLNTVENMPPVVLPTEIKNDPSEYPINYPKNNQTEHVTIKEEYPSNYTQFNQNEQDDITLVNYFTKIPNQNLYGNAEQNVEPG